MDFDQEENGDITIIVFGQKALDASNAAAMKKEVQPLLKPGAKVIFDLGQVEFVDSSGLGAILSCLRLVTSQDGDLKLCSVTKTVRVLLQLVRFHRILDILNSREDALRAYRA